MARNRSVLFVFFVISVVISQSNAKVTLPPELQEYVDYVHNLCLKKEGISEDDHQLYDIKHKNEKIMVKQKSDLTGPKIFDCHRCYMKCLMLDAKWMNNKGVIDYNFIEQQAHPEVKEILMAAMSKCRNIEDGANLCEKAYNFNHCLYEADPENWFLV